MQVLLPVSGEVPLGGGRTGRSTPPPNAIGLPIGVHAGSSYRHPVTGVGWPGSYTEDYVNQAVAFQSAL